MSGGCGKSAYAPSGHGPSKGHGLSIGSTACKQHLFIPFLVVLLEQELREPTLLEDISKRFGAWHNLHPNKITAKPFSLPQREFSPATRRHRSRSALPAQQCTKGNEQWTQETQKQVEHITHFVGSQQR